MESRITFEQALKNYMNGIDSTFLIPKGNDSGDYRMEILSDLLYKFRDPDIIILSEMAPKTKKSTSGDKKKESYTGKKRGRKPKSNDSNTLFSTSSSDKLSTEDIKESLENLVEVKVPVKDSGNKFKDPISPYAIKKVLDLGKLQALDKAGWSIESIAKELHITKATVKKYMSYLRSGELTVIPDTKFSGYDEPEES